MLVDERLPAAGAADGRDEVHAPDEVHVQPSQRGGAPGEDEAAELGMGPRPERGALHVADDPAVVSGAVGVARVVREPAVDVPGLVQQPGREPAGRRRGGGCGGGLAPGAPAARRPVPRGQRLRHAARLAAVGRLDRRDAQPVEPRPSHGRAPGLAVVRLPWL